MPMTAASPAFLPRTEDLPPRPAPVDHATLNRLRFLAMSCRAARRMEMTEACALLSLNRSTQVRVYAETLIRSLTQALGYRIATA